MTRIRRLLFDRRRRNRAILDVDIAGFEAAREALGRAAQRNAGTSITA